MKETNNIMDQNNQNWYVIYTPLVHGKSAELMVNEAFNSRNIKACLWIPFQNIKRIRYGREIDDTIPLFPNYLFVQTILNSGLEQEMEQALLELKAGYFLKYPGDTLPAIISEDDIKKIQEIQDKEVSETKVEDEIESSPTYTPIEIGTYVEVATGSLMGVVKGIVVDSKKYTIKVETFFFGRSTSVEVPISALVCTSSVPPEN